MPELYIDKETMRTKPAFWQKLKKRPSLMLVVVIFAIILLGGTLLSLPISSKTQTFTPFIDSLFTAASAVCVTGLTTLNTAQHWSIFGQVLILILIQFGGLGFSTAATAFALAFKKRVSMSDRLVIQEERNTSSLQGMVKLIKFILLATFLIEGIGAVLLSFRFIPTYGLQKGIWFSVFHSVSAFCNAGFDIIGENSLMPFNNDPLVILTIGFLIILGGLGWHIFSDVLQKRKPSRLSLHSKLSLSVMAFLLVTGTLIVFLLEMNNAQTLQGSSVATALLNAFFQSVTVRTAGFFSVDQVGLRDATAFILITFMLIGGNSAGTAGGIKTSTVAVLALTARAQIRGHKDATAFGRRISAEAVRKAVTLLLVASAFVCGVTFVLMLTEPGMQLIDLLFETVSAFATVGLTRGVTPYLSTVGKLLIIMCMFFGKVGLLTVTYAIAKRDKRKDYREAEGTVLIG